MYRRPDAVLISDSPEEKYFQDVIPTIARAAHTAMSGRRLDLGLPDDCAELSRMWPEGWFGFAAKIGSSFTYRLIMRVARSVDEYTDLNGWTQHRRDLKIRGNHASRAKLHEHAISRGSGCARSDSLKREAPIYYGLIRRSQTRSSTVNRN